MEKSWCDAPMEMLYTFPLSVEQWPFVESKCWISPLEVTIVVPFSSSICYSYSQHQKNIHDLRCTHCEVCARLMRAYIGPSGKNSGDIKLVVDALEAALEPNNVVDTFVIASGDSDFTPLLSKLRLH